MSMPVDLVFVRHGESEGNIVSRISKNGDESVYTKEFLSRHSSHWRLSNLGVEQAKATGIWLRKEFPQGFGRQYTSDYDRAKETAAHLGFDENHWLSDFNLRERDWGIFDSMPPSEREKSYAHALAARDKDPFYWSPPQGESMAQVSLRLNRILETLHRECSQETVVCVCHGEFMWNARVILERLPLEIFRSLHNSQDDHDHLFNGHVLHYTRRDPKTGELRPYLCAFRSVCPWDTTLSSNEWQTITRPTFTSQDLLDQVNRWPRIIEG